MNPLLKLRDIQGIDPISFWPLAMGWWILIAVFAGTLISLTTILTIRRRRNRRWQYQVLNELSTLSSKITATNSQSIAIQFSGIMRRVAMHRFSRNACAGLEGEAWLKWLTENDRSQFSWVQNSSFLVLAPFAPNGTQFDVSSIQKTIRAAKAWVK
jgi:NhaP-type Na+/H+ or K+/H+ antiporter